MTGVEFWQGFIVDLERQRTERYHAASALAPAVWDLAAMLRGGEMPKTPQALVDAWTGTGSTNTKKKPEDPRAALRASWQKALAVQNENTDG